MDFWRATGAWPVRLDEMDDAVAEYVECLWAEGGLCSRARFLVAGIQHFIPAARRHMDLSWSLVRTWQQMEPPIRAVPLSCEMVLALAALARLRRAPDIAVLLLVGFGAILSGVSAARTVSSVPSNCSAEDGLSLCKCPQEFLKPLAMFGCLPPFCDHL